MEHPADAFGRRNYAANKWIVRGAFCEFSSHLPPSPSPSLSLFPPSRFVLYKISLRRGGVLALPGCSRELAARIHGRKCACRLLPAVITFSRLLVGASERSRADGWDIKFDSRVFKSEIITCYCRGRPRPAPSEAPASFRRPPLPASTFFPDNAVIRIPALALPRTYARKTRRTVNADNTARKMGVSASALTGRAGGRKLCSYIIAPGSWVNSDLVAIRPAEATLQAGS